MRSLCPKALLTVLYCSTDRLFCRGAAMENLPHSASFQSAEKIAPPNLLGSENVRFSFRLCGMASVAYVSRITHSDETSDTREIVRHGIAGNLDAGRVEPSMRFEQLIISVCGAKGEHAGYAASR